MRRVFGAIFIALGAMLLVAAAALPTIVAPAAAKLPYDMQPCPATNPPDGCQKPSVAEAKGATFLQIDSKGVRIESGDLRSTTEVIPQAKLTADEQAKGNLTDDAIVWDVYSTVQRIDDGTVISASSTELAMDRVSGAAVAWKGQWISESADAKDTSIAYKGQVYKFPFNTEKKDYAYWDGDTLAAPMAKFTAVEAIEGVETYHFIQTIPETQVKVDDSSLATLIGVFAKDATTGKVTYSNTREVWVDPVTGAFVKVREQPRKTFTPDVGAPVDLLKADFSYTAATTKNSAQSAKDNGFLLGLVKLYAPVGAGLLGLVLLLGGFLMIRVRKSEGEGDDYSDLPEARHSLRDQPTWSN